MVEFSPKSLCWCPTISITGDHEVELGLIGGKMYFVLFREKAYLRMIGFCLPEEKANLIQLAKTKEQAKQRRLAD